ncbi:MAG: hypothetical protein V3V03_06135 [Hyphomonadaceae bacterium]
MKLANFLLITPIAITALAVAQIPFHLAFTNQGLINPVFGLGLLALLTLSGLVLLASEMLEEARDKHAAELQ